MYAKKVDLLRRCILTCGDILNKKFKVVGIIFCVLLITVLVLDWFIRSKIKWKSMKRLSIFALWWGPNMIFLFKRCVVNRDNGREIMNCLLEIYFRDRGIVQETSHVHTPHQKWASWIEKSRYPQCARALQLQTPLLIQFLSGCVLAAAHPINCTNYKVAGWGLLMSSYLA